MDYDLIVCSGRVINPSQRATILRQERAGSSWHFLAFKR
jgi:hypothetical protein